MGITQCFIMALKSLSTSKMRAFLTMLGIIIGVAAVILIMSLGNGMTIYINDMFAEMGTTTVNVTITGRGSTRTVDADDMYEFYEELIEDMPWELSYSIDYDTVFNKLQMTMSITKNPDDEIFYYSNN